MNFKLVLLLALCCTLVVAKNVDRLDVGTEQTPQLRKDVVKREDHDAVYLVEDKEENNVYSVQTKGDGLKLSAVNKRSTGDNEKSKSGCCG